MPPLWALRARKVATIKPSIYTNYWCSYMLRTSIEVNFLFSPLYIIRKIDLKKKGEYNTKYNHNGIHKVII